MGVKQGSSGAGEGFEVTKFGHGRVALIGFPRFVISLLCLLTTHKVQFSSGRIVSIAVDILIILDRLCN